MLEDVTAFFMGTCLKRSSTKIVTMMSGTTACKPIHMWCWMKLHDNFLASTATVGSPIWIGLESCFPSYPTPTPDVVRPRWGQKTQNQVQYGNPYFFLPMENTSNIERGHDFVRKMAQVQKWRREWLRDQMMYLQHHIWFFWSLAWNGFNTTP